MIDLYTCFDEMQGLYDKFSKHSKTLEDHHHWLRKESTTLDRVSGWKNHIKERSYGLPILDELQLKTTEVSIETWEGMCDSVEALINAGQIICEQRWLYSKDSLTYYEFTCSGSYQ